MADDAPERPPLPALTKLRSERGQMSAMDRRITDYILANARLLRDYSSQQLADALMRGIERYFAKNPPLARSRSV